MVLMVACWRYDSIFSGNGAMIVYFLEMNSKRCNFEEIFMIVS